jgi:nucleotide-binding universal stress UspA family protein
MSSKPSGYRRILVAIDFSASTAHTLAVAIDMATAFKARLDLAHVVPLNGTGEREGQEALAKLAPPAAAGLIDLRSVTKALSPDLGLLQLARERNSDLIVMGTHGRTGLPHIRLGSTAERVVQHAGCPVLTVRSPDFEYQRP